MWLLKVLGIQLGLLTIAVVAANDVKLRVSVRKEAIRRVAACVHSFSQVELLNLHKTDAVTITSVQILPEETLVRFTNQQKGTKVVKEALPQQLHLSRLPTGTLTLGPGQVAIVPMTFLPRYPHDTVEMPMPTVFEHKDSPPRISVYQRTDLAEMIGREGLRRHPHPSIPRNNLAYEPIIGQTYEVHTKVVVQTTQGVVTLPISASSYRNNGYQVPERILFHPSHLIQPYFPPDDGDAKNVVVWGTIDRGNPHDREVPKVPTKDCYDLYMTNPHDEKAIRILEIVVSKPELATLYDMEKDVRFENPRQSFSNWNGEFWLAPGASQHYMITVCPLDSPNPNDQNCENESAKVDEMGYLQIRTDSDTLFIQLERSLAPVVPPVPTQVVNRVPQLPTLQKARATKNPSLAARVPRPTTPSLNAFPGKIKLHVVPYVSPTSTFKFGIRNPSKKPIKIMRVMLGLDGESDTAMREIGVDVKMVLGRNSSCESLTKTQPFCSTSGIVGAESTVHDALILNCSVDSEQAINSLAVKPHRGRFTGTIVIRATGDLEMSYHDWRDGLRRNPFKEQDMVIEIPFVLYVINSDILNVVETSSTSAKHLRWENDVAGVRSVRALFFPFRYFGRRPWEYWKGTAAGRDYDYDQDAFGYHLRILSTSHFPLNLTKLEIVDQDGVKTSLCSQFMAVISEQTSRKTKFGLFDLGVITMAYRYSPNAYKRRGHGVDTTRFCRLSFSTIPISTGRHDILLNVFSGKVDVSLHPGQLGREKNPDEAPYNLTDENANLFVGEDMVTDWMRSHRIGVSLGNYLFRHYEKYLPRDQVFTAFYDSLCADAEFKERKVEPVLINVGAVGHGELHHIPLYFTNTNPVPVQLFVDASEIEGMSITIARVSGRETGDAVTIADFLVCREYPGEVTRIEEGRWKSHSRPGLREFLKSSDAAKSLFAYVPYKDDIKLSDVAAHKYPHLPRLYRKKARATFHMESMPLHHYSTQTRVCPGGDKKPADFAELFFVNDDMPVDDTPLPGPLLVTDDLTIVHPTLVCDPDLHDHTPEKSLSLYRHPPVVLAPGAVARFDLKIRSPPKVFLDRDITPFVNSGLLVSTDHGEAIPILVAFEALLGQILVSTRAKSPVFEAPENDPVREVADTTFSIRFDDGTGDDSEITSPTPFINLWGRTERLPLYLSSTFSRVVTIRYIESCNAWFIVRLHTNTLYTGDAPVEVGSVTTLIPCPVVSTMQSSLLELHVPHHDPSFPSFYQCASAWIGERSKLQPNDCGFAPSRRRTIETESRDEDRLLNRADNAMMKAFSLSLFKYSNRTLMNPSYPAAEGHQSNETNTLFRGGFAGGSFVVKDSNPVKTGEARGSEFLDPAAIDVFAEMTECWRLLAENNLHTISTTLSAKIHYSVSDETAEGEKQGRRAREEENLMVSMRSLFIRAELKMPKLFHKTSKSPKRLDDEETKKEYHISFMDFPSTSVAGVSARYIPLKNPTNMPVKVKLAVLPAKAFEGYRDENKLLSHTGVRERYLQNTGPIYAQSFTESEDELGHSWWDGAGSFCLHDDDGNLLQSRHNFTLPVPKAQVSLVNPSLHSQNAFVVGCGLRCGIRDEGSSDKSNRRKSSSTIGASAAAGISLMGRWRSSIESDNNPSGDEPFQFAGGTNHEEAAPAAFAIPYSAFDEIVIPPRAQAKLGPIFFRPPGRHSILGCEAVLNSKSLPWGMKVSQACGFQEFETVLFLENSLTGLERVVLRGKGQWESIAFLDKAPRTDDNNFGDVIYRNGRSTLMFPGTGIEERKGFFQRTIHSVIRGIVVMNQGDTPIEFKRLYFSDATRLTSNGKNTRTPTKDVVAECEYRGFRLLGCQDNDLETVQGMKNAYRNRKFGFRLEPGESEALYFEHVPDCVRRTEFVSMQFEIAEDGPAPELFDDGMLLFQSGAGRRLRSKKSSRLFKKRKIEFLVGFDMSASELESCKAVQEPAPNVGIYASGLINVTKWNDRSIVTPPEQMHKPNLIATGLKLAVGGFFTRKPTYFRRVALYMCGVLALLVVFMVPSLASFRSKTSRRFRAMLRSTRTKLELHDGKNHAGFSSAPVYNWAAAFRCLARADPTSSELQTIGREQVRQIVLNRYKAMGILSPQCIDTTGAFVRENAGSSSSSSSARSSGKDGTLAHNEKMMTLSDAIFHGCDPDTNEGVAGSTPLGLGWRTAASRGVIRKGARLSRIVLKSRALVKERSPAPKHSPSAESNNKSSVGPKHGKESEARHRGNGNSHHERTTVNVISISESEGASTKDEDSQIIGAIGTTSPQSTKKDTGEPKRLPLTRVLASNNKETKKGVGKAEDANESPADDLVPVQISEVKPIAESQVVPPKTTRKPIPTPKNTRAKDRRPPIASRSRSDETSSTDSSSMVNKKAPPKKKGAPASSSKPDRLTGKKNSKRGSSASARANRVVSASISKAMESSRSATPSSPSSNKSGSSRSTTRTDSPQQQNQMTVKEATTESSTSESSSSALFRPPPGLPPPPPGFGVLDSPSDPSFKNPSLATPFAPDTPLPVDDLSSILLSPQPTASVPPFNENSEAALRLLYSPATPSSNTSTGASLFQTIRETDEKALDVDMSQSLSDLPALPATDGEGPRALSGTPVSRDANSDDGLLSRSPDSDKALLGWGSGFNVMDFLDNIMDEARVPGNEGPGDLLSDRSSDSGGLTATPSLSISSNPWSLQPERKSSRAAAYGITVEDSNEQMAQGSNASSIVEAIIASSSTSPKLSSEVTSRVVPLLTANTIVPAQAQEDEEEDDEFGGFVFDDYNYEDEEDDDDAFKGGAFYSNLLSGDPLLE